MGNHLFYGDNLAVLRESIASESVDLIYLDPPFNSNASHNVLFRGPAGQESAAQIEAFDDTWHWNGAAKMQCAMRSCLDENDMMVQPELLVYHQGLETDRHAASWLT